MSEERAAEAVERMMKCIEKAVVSLAQAACHAGMADEHCPPQGNRIIRERRMDDVDGHLFDAVAAVNAARRIIEEEP